MLSELIYGMMLTHVPPGHTKFSVAVAAECSADVAQPCEGATWSSFYSAWVRKETAEQGAERYRVIAESLVRSAEKVICRTEHGEPIEGCNAISKKRWDVLTLSVAGAAVATLESGFREDVMVGRGWAKLASDDGGMGRGPGREGCALQIHPKVAWRFAEADRDLLARARSGNGEAQEAVVLSLLGSDPAALDHCWAVGLRMLVHSREHCAWAAPKEPWDQAMISLFGTGDSCTSTNRGKTMLRTRLFRTMLAEARAKRRAERAASPAAS